MAVILYRSFWNNFKYSYFSTVVQATATKFGSMMHTPTIGKNCSTIGYTYAVSMHWVLLNISSIIRPRHSL